MVTETKLLAEHNPYIYFQSNQSFPKTHINSILQQRLRFFSRCFGVYSLQVHPELYVDTSRGDKLKINIDVIFPHMPCACM